VKDKHAALTLFDFPPRGRRADLKWSIADHRPIQFKRTSHRLRAKANAAGRIPEGKCRGSHWQK
jgi:hypothetical protein